MLDSWLDYAKRLATWRGATKELHLDLELVERITNAVLYEGYMLYPYRASTAKNRQRFTFGRIYPRAFSQAQGGVEPYTMQTECLIQSMSGSASPLLTAAVRFLHPMARQVGQLSEPLAVWSPDHEPAFQPVSELRVDDRIYQTWEEATEQRVDLPPTPLSELCTKLVESPFTFAPQRRLEPIADEQGRIVGILARQQEAVSGCIELRAKEVASHLFQVTCRVLNLTPLASAADHRSEDAPVLMRTFASTHTLLTVSHGAFLSQLDPPPWAASFAAMCQNEGTWPVLVGAEEKDERDMLLSSPIILYDYPEIAPESAGDLFDSTEVDEILTLRIMTMTDEEKWEMSQVDERARQILQRTESLAGEDLLRMHGVLRELPPGNEEKE